MIPTRCIDANLHQPGQFKSTLLEWGFLSSFFSFLLSAALPQAPLYTSNQNTYLLHTVKSLYWYKLADDWLASTVDPFPLFTSITAAKTSMVGEWVIHCAFIVVYFVLFRSLFEIGSILLESKMKKSPSMALILLFTMISMFILPDIVVYLSNRFGLNIESRLSWFPLLTRRGLAGQGIVSTIYQPSIYGVFLVASIALFCRKKLVAAAVFLGASPLFHATYILSSIALGLSFMLSIKVSGEKIDSRQIQAAMLVYIFCTSAFIFSNYSRIFSTSEASLINEAKDILFDFRIPHHADPAVWLNRTSFFQIALMTGGVALSSNKSLRLPLASLLLLIILGIPIQIVLGSKSIALLFPWRSSTILAPISSVLIISILFSSIPGLLTLVNDKNRRLILIISSVFLMLMSIHNAKSYLVSRTSNDLLAIDIRAQYKSGDIFMVPVALGNTGLSENIRLSAGVPIFIDFKSHPYQPEELIEWKRRVELASSFYSADNSKKCKIASDIFSNSGEWKGSGITVIVDTLEPGGHVGGLADCKSTKIIYTKHGNFMHRSSG